jgi:hypothetical protein
MLLYIIEINIDIELVEKKLSFLFPKILLFL